MKKKKLKKRLKIALKDISKLEREVKELNRKEINLSNWTMAKVNDLNKRVSDSEKEQSQMQRDNRINILWEWMQRSGIDFHDWGKTPTYAEEVVYTEDIQRQINEINDKLNILDNRTKIDYSSFTEATKDGN